VLVELTSAGTMYLPHRQHLAECNLKLTHTNIYNILCVYSIIHLQ